MSLGRYSNVSMRLKSIALQCEEAAATAVS